MGGVLSAIHRAGCGNGYDRRKHQEADSWN